MEILTSLKRVRQLTRQLASSVKFGFEPHFPDLSSVPRATPIYLVGSGTSLLKWDSSSSDEGIRIAMNDAIFSHNRFDFFSFEKGKNQIWLDAIEPRLGALMAETDTRVLCQLPQNITDLTSYPNAFRAHPKRVHMFGSLSLSPRETIQETVIRETICFKQMQKWYVGQDPGFTLGRLALRFAAQGFQDIRLAGVDLTSPNFFWEYVPELHWLRDARMQGTSLVNSPQGVHSTQEKSRKFPAKSFVVDLASAGVIEGFRIRCQSISPLSSEIDSWD